MALDDDMAILAEAPLFGLMSRDALRLLTFAAERRDLARGEVLFRRGDRADGGYVVLSGTIELAPRAAGGEPIRAGRSALIGRNALFLRGERPTEARAVTAAGVMRVTPTLMNRVLQEFPDAADAIRGWLADDLRDLVRGLEGARRRLTGAAAGPGDSRSGAL